MFLKWNAGTENAFLNYAKILKDCGFNVINLIHPKSQIIEKLKTNNCFYIKSLFLGRLAKADIFTLLYFKYLIKKHKINLVFCHQGRLASLFKKIHNKDFKLIVVNHGHNYKHAVGSDLAILLNKDAYQKTLESGQPKEKITILPNWIDINLEFNKLKQYKRNNKIFTIGSYGRFSKEKGYDILIEALKILNSKKIPFKCLIGGIGEEENNLKSLATKYKLNDKIKFVGWVKNKKQFLSQIDLFVNPARKEEFGLILLEAANYGAAVLSTNCSGPKDIIDDNINGFLTEKENPQKMAEKLQLITEKYKKNSLENIRVKSFEKLEKKYSVQVVKKQLKALILTYLLK